MNGTDSRSQSGGRGMELRQRVRERLCADTATAAFRAVQCSRGRVRSSVLLPLGEFCPEPGAEPEACVILNKRSRRVKQPGDLCCPGGGVDPWIDPLLALLVRFNGNTRCPWSQSMDRTLRRQLKTYWATCIRESWEEMRLNPFRVRFLGVLPPQRLTLFKRIIYPFVGWVQGQAEFRPNWEVEKVVTVPLSSLFDENRYARYRLYVAPELAGRIDHGTRDLPCFLHQDGVQVDILWGATFRIVMVLLKTVFDFEPPDPARCPIVPGILDEGYLNGRT